ncbi:MAG TPA: DNA translocase FtsK 4TM domain-containing protein, partial [Candidatus Limnocylindria bacterium]
MATRRRTTPRRRTTRRRRQTTPFVLSGRFLREAVALVLVLLAIISVIALFAPDAGAIVRPWHDVLSTLLGWGIAFAAPLLAGFALMLWMKTMPAERWMAASGAALVALALLGMFHLSVGGSAEAVETGQGGGAIGFGVSALLSGAVGNAGAWIVLVLLAIVGLLLYFNMTIGDLVAAYLAGRDERREQEAEAARRAEKRPR